jgi:thiamine-phosphate pyrophosphorylase
MTSADDPRHRLLRARVYLVLTRRLCRRPPLEVLTLAIEGGCDLVQVREPELADGALLSWAGEVKRVAGRSGVPVIVNDRPDVAMISGADGVHLGQSDLPVRSVRELSGDRLLIGLSTHSRAEMESATASPADYCGLGPVFDTTTKPLAGRGLDLVREVLPVAVKPTFVIGGIGVESIAGLAAAGVTRVAVSSAICSAADPASVARALRSALA